MQDGSRREKCQDAHDCRAANHEKHRSDEPVARRQPRLLSSQNGARAIRCIGGYISAYLRDILDGQAEVLIGTRTYLVRKMSVGPVDGYSLSRNHAVLSMLSDRPPSVIPALFFSVLVE
jgi:hypothetical protein